MAGYRVKPTSLPLELMSKSRKVPMLRRGPRREGVEATVMVDPQILEWRKRIKKENITLGPTSARAKKHSDASKEERAKGPIGKRKWF